MATSPLKRFSSLRFKFALSLALFSSLLMIATIALLEQRLRETLIRESIDKGLGIARGLAFNAEDPLLTGDDLYLFSAVSNAIRAPGLTYASILDRDRMVRADTRMERVGTIDQPEPGRILLQEHVTHRVYRTARPGTPGRLDLEVPIMTVADTPIRVGTIHLGLTEELIAGDISRMRLQLAGLALAALVIGILGAIVVAGMLVGPLTALVRGVKAIGDGNLDQHIDLRRNDEIGLLTDAFNEMAASLRDKEFIKSTFERYVSKPLAEQILQKKDELQLGGEVRDVTILFSDIRRFTSLAEQLPPERVVEILNDYFTRMIQVVARHEGMVDKLMGDSVMALFGAPISLGDDPLRAVRCALEMQEAGAEYNRVREAEGLPQLPMGIGINTGPVVAGNIGSATKMEYTVIGDEVNIAARLQGIAQPGEVLISEGTYRLLRDHLVVTALEPMVLKGKKASVSVFRVDGLRENE